MDQEVRSDRVGRDFGRAGPLLYPSSIAIVGASPEPRGWSARIFQNLRTYSFPGPVYPINPKYNSVWGTACYPSVSALPSPPEQLLFIVGADRCLEVLANAPDETRSCVIYAGGFGEDGTEEGLRRRYALADLLERKGIVALGPNCLGFVSFPASTFTLTEQAPGRQIEGTGGIAVLAQSGGGATTLNRKLNSNGAPTRYCVSSGNELSLTLEDWLETFLADDDVEAVALFLETVKDADRFLALCARAQRQRRPIVAAKLGASAESRAAALAHTGRLAGASEVFNALASEVGVIPATTLDDIIDTLSVFRSKHPVKRGHLGGVTVSGGLKGIFLDSAARAQMRFPSPSKITLEQQASYLGVGTAPGNPVDTGWSGIQDSSVLIRAARDLAHDPVIDCVLLQGSPGRSLWEQLSEVADETGKLMVIPDRGFSSGEPNPDDAQRIAASSGVAFCASADRAVRALGRLVAYEQHRSDLEPDGGEIGDAPGFIKAVLHELVTDPSMSEFSIKQSLARIGVRIPRHEMMSPESAPPSPPAIGWPVVVKGVAPSVQHKSALGLVSPPVWNVADLESELKRIRSNWASAFPGEPDCQIWLEQAMLGGVECVIGIVRDSEFGPVIMFGAGGTAVELTRDVSFGRTPLSARRARDLIGRTKIGSQLLAARANRDIEGLVELVVLIAQIGVDLPREVVGIDLNPVTVLAPGRGAVVLDALVEHA